MAMTDHLRDATPMRLQWNGRFTIRELRGSETQACDVFFRRLDPQDIRWRFASPRSSPGDLLPGAGRGNGSVAFAARDAADTIVGVLNLERLNSDCAEIGVVVRSDRKRLGIGRALLAHAIRWAGCVGLSRVTGYVLAENLAMLDLAGRMGFRCIRRDLPLLELARLVTAKRSDDAEQPGIPVRQA